MSFPRYPKYKDSGVEWLGEVPEHWNVCRLSPLSTKITNGYVGPTRDILVDEGIRYLQSLHIKANSIRFDSPYFVREEWSNQHEKSILKTGDVLIVQTGDIGQATVVTPEFAGCNCHALIIVAPRKQLVSGQWISLVLNSHYGFHTLLSIQTGALHPHLNCGDVKDISIPLPPTTEQMAIAEFLDHETAKIDALVAEQRRLIELLKEKHQAVISHAVTKGLNPNVPMKSSGIEWLGDIPEHWDVKGFQRCVSIAEGQVDPKTPGFAEMVLIAPNHIESGTGKLLDLEVAEDQGAISGKYFCMAGDVIYSKIRPALRKACLAPHDCLCSADMYPLRAHSGMTNEYLFRWLLTEQFSAFAVLESDRVAMPKINRESLKEVRFALPPVEEQREICGFIKSQISRLDQLAAEGERAIELLQERRTALISAAVTGKVDVRGLASSES